MLLPGQEPLEKKNSAENVSYSASLHNQQNTPMNTPYPTEQKNTQKSPQKKPSGITIAFGIIIGLIIFILIISLAFRFLPFVGNSIANVFSALFSPANTESVRIDAFPNTLPLMNEAEVSFTYLVKDTVQNVDTQEPFIFSYECTLEKNVLLEVRHNEGEWRPLPCSVPYTTFAQNIFIRPAEAREGMSVLEISVQKGNLKNTKTIFITSSNEEEEERVNEREETTETSSADEEESTSSEVQNIPQRSTPPAPTFITVSRYTGPSDLALSIIETGMMIGNTFYPVATIPRDKKASVRFTVTNIGGVESGAWGFIATLPTDKDSSHRYISPLQKSLPSGMQGTFTLSFDEITQRNEGSITIEIVPGKAGDPTINNTQSVRIYTK
jgi:hypothetical protein